MTTSILDKLSVTVPGTSGETYLLDLKVRGTFGLSRYDGGSNDGGFLQKGGAQNSSDSGRPRIKLTVSNPNQTFYLNRTASAPGAYNQTVEYRVVVEAVGGATLTLAVENATTQNGMDAGGAVPEHDSDHLVAGYQTVFVEFSTDITADVTEKLGGVVRDFVWTGFEENVYGVKAER